MIDLKILIFSLFHLNILFFFYVLSLQPVINTCLIQMYTEEVLHKLQIVIGQYRIYHCNKKEFLIWLLESIIIYHLL
jgi:hypothetical protein